MIIYRIQLKFRMIKILTNKILLFFYIYFQLSPALRNRFTEIWCPSSDSDKDIIKIIEHNIKMGVILGSNDNSKFYI